ncbi:MAG: 4a-hydroxytetrahydrobiopterin dehydratase [Lentisphaerae bacterium RIFOXYB12_FULL_65_16]|nr:MAG: 4a-hydroxytetrahydrobiopterin dehydratase [Lentisphaerae bacterium RIFOXYA12_64_32]OGV93939.1 MAG: 4a-hydroxytetrahydrobiopterin dehydratase [Lentisphaerae bacterium RIFOXYB12_FULL_65_16]
MNETNPVACSLADRECVPCRGGVPPLKDAALKALADQLGPAWQVVDEHHLEKKFRFPDFRQALDFTVRIGELAEQANHHPDIHLAWGKVVVTLWTHKIGGLAEADFVFAAKVDRLAGG